MSAVLFKKKKLIHITIKKYEERWIKKCHQFWLKSRIVPVF